MKQTHPQKIYSDDKREATWKPGSITIFSKVAKKSLPTIPMRLLILDAKIQRATIDTLKKSGQNPADYRAIYRAGSADMVAPTNVAETIFGEANRLEKEYQAECDRVANLPENRDRREIEELYEKAYRIEHSSSEDNVMVPAQLRALARQKMAEWREKYQDAARDEDARELLSKASDLRSKAVGALVYDADGWISRGEQQKRHDEYIKEAEELEARARAIKE